MLAAGLVHAVQGQTKADPVTAPKESKAKLSGSTARQKVLSLPEKQKAEKCTGSHIPRCMRRHGTITEAPYNLVVIDQDMIRQSGAATLPQVLDRYGLRR